MTRTAAGLAALLCASALASAPARAADPCAGTTQMDLNACAGSAYERADGAMNVAYGRLMKQIGPKARDGLRAAQKAWLPFRDASCALEAMGVAGGSMRPQVQVDCLARLTAARQDAGRLSHLRRGRRDLRRPLQRVIERRDGDSVG